MKRYLFLCLVMAGPHPGFSQGRDTVFAVRKLFREKRTAGEGLLTAGADIASGTQYAQRPEGRPTAQEARGDGLVSAAFTGVGMAKQTRYSTENEAYILRLYAEGQPIPPDIRRKLRRKHFHRSAKDILLN